MYAFLYRVLDSNALMCRPLLPEGEIFFLLLLSGRLNCVLLFFVVVSLSLLPSPPAVLRLPVLVRDAHGHQGHGGRVHQLRGHRHELLGVPHHPQAAHQGTPVLIVFYLLTADFDLFNRVAIFFQSSSGDVVF